MTGWILGALLLLLGLILVPGMAEFGLNTLAKTGRAVMCIADGDMSGMKVGGISLELNTMAAVAVDTTLTDDTVVAAGTKYLRYGQIMTKITVISTDVVTVNGVPTGGTFTISVTVAGNTQTTAGLAFNAAGATVQTALQGLSNVGAGNATVVGAGPYTITFPAALGAVTVAANGAALTGGTNPSATVAVTSTGSIGKFGPFDPAAADGRQTLTRGEAFIVNRTWMASPAIGFPNLGIVHSPVFDKGLVWKERILMTTGAHSLAAGPTVAEFEAVFPNVRYNEQ
jgi:hypothetical protein